MVIKPAYVQVQICVHLPHLNLLGREMEVPRPLMVITLKLHSFHISHFFKCELNLPHLNFEFSTLIPSKIGLNFCEMLIGNEAYPTTSSMKSGHRS